MFARLFHPLEGGGSRRIHHALRFMFVSLAGLAVAGGFAGHARAVIPPYAEEWEVPASVEDVDVDPSGRVWVSCDDDSVRVYTPTGGQLLFAFGGTGSGDGEFHTPYGIAFDPSGEAYICDYVGARLEKFTSEGAFLLSWAIPSTNADHVAVDAAGDVYVSGYTDFSVHKYTSTGVSLLDWSSNGGSQTSGVVEVNGIVYVVQWDEPVVEEFTTGGDYLASFDASTSGGTDIEVDTLGQLWVADFNHNMIRVFTTSGDPVDAFGALGSGPGEFNGAIGIGIGLEGSIYVADQYNNRVQRFGEPVASASDQPMAHPAGLTIGGIAPNPCRASVELTYAVARAENLRITVTDVAGRTIAKLADGPVTAGEHRITWEPRGEDGRRLAAGHYLIRLAGEHGASVGRLVVVD
jgi:DNA-binding beta-propeller fold protein YncE